VFVFVAAADFWRNFIAIMQVDGKSGLCYAISTVNLLCT